MRRQCGSIIVKDGNIIGRGHNSPPAHKEGQRRCNVSKDIYSKKVTDKTCCIHAEQRAIIDTLTNKENIEGSDLYFTSVDKKNIVYSENPYCTICSKLALDIGIKNFILWHKEGIRAYDAEEYNNLSFNYKESIS